MMDAYQAAYDARDADAMLLALADLEKLQPDETRWPFERGCLHGEFQRDEEAIAAFRRVLEIDPNHLDSVVNLGRHLDDTNQFTEALAQYDHALTLPGGAEDAICLANRGNTLLALERFEDALDSLNRSLAIEADQPAVRAKQTALGYMGRVDECNAARVEGPFDRGELVQLTRPLTGKRLIVRYWTGRHTQPDWLHRSATEMIDWIASLENTAPGLGDGITIQYAWSALTLRERNGDLVVCEPDYAFAPWTRKNWDVGFTLQTDIMHKLLLENCEAEASMTTMHDAVAIQPGCVGDQRVEMHRMHPSKDGFSGWLVGPEGTFSRPVDPKMFKPVRSGDLTRIRHPLIKALMLPPKYTVVFDAHAVVSVKDPSGNEVWDI